MYIENLEALAESFDLFDDWEDRYRFLIDLGQRLEPMDPALKTEARLVKGCTSRVWLAARIDENTQGQKIFHFMADSDAQIVKGLIYILAIAYQDQPIEKIPLINIELSFERLGLGGHLSPSRRNGFFSTVDRIKEMGASGGS
ncbi:MAG: Fe-S cluster assembly protein SufE [Alphaproteobacteria bacterium CG_4_9_14_3_um_filter_47_13]|nr:MAG: Fe-S cluster assembly protein SufE [Alphaproteobacteria bacterium CG_4_9_14_3_um_filter_47_13]